MITPEERALALVQTLKRDFSDIWIPGRMAAVLSQLIITEIRQAQAEVWAEVKRDCEKILDTGAKSIY
jgi:hypothetical protein